MSERETIDPRQQDAARFLTRFCRVMERRDEDFRGWALQGHRSGLLLRLAGVDLLVQRRGAQSWRTTPSFSLCIQGDLPDGHEPVLERFVSWLQKADPGDLEVAAARPEIPAVDEAEAKEAHEELADELHRAAFIAYQALVLEDLYPHVGPLGQAVSSADIEEGWRVTAQRIRQGTAPSRLGLYLHVPFCLTTCSFCYCGRTDRFDGASIDAWLEQLAAECELFAERFEGIDFTSVYVGGGTPSLLSPKAMRRVFETLYGAFHVPEGTQVIYEGNPDTLSDRKIEVLANEGRVTRLTIGVQALDAEVQRHIGRFNKPEHVAKAVKSARARGIPHVNTDLMAGLPGQNMEAFQRDMRFLISLNPDSVHLNAFRPLPRVKAARGGFEAGPEWKEQRAEMMRWGTRELADEGYKHRSGPGGRRTRDAKNVQSYDLRRQNSSLLGLGFGARSHAFGSYFYTTDRHQGFDKSLQRDLAGERRWWAVPSSDLEERHKYLVANLRAGFDLQQFRDLFGSEAQDTAPSAFEKLRSLGVLRIESDRVHTDSGDHASNLQYRTFFYSEALQQRIDEVWGPQYRRDEDYMAKLAALVEAYE